MPEFELGEKVVFSKTLVRIGRWDDKAGETVKTWEILHPGADTRTELAAMLDGLRAIGEAYARVFENGLRATKAFADAVAADLRRSNEARARRLRTEQLAFLNRPVVTMPTVGDVMNRGTGA